MLKLFFKTIGMLCLVFFCSSSVYSQALSELEATSGSAELLDEEGLVVFERLSETAEFRLCSQNIFNYGSQPHTRIKKKEAQRKYLVKRFVDAKCDVIALQEIYGANFEQATKNLSEIQLSLSEKTGRKFLPYVGATNDKFLRNGFLVAEDIGPSSNFTSYSKTLLPKLQSRGPARYFARGPVAITINIDLKEDELKEEEEEEEGKKKKKKKEEPLELTKQVRILTMHFKSSLLGWKDPTKTNFESLRMEMAEGLRALTAEETKNLDEGALLIVAGDRNTDFPSASTSIFSGERVLSDFADQSCRLGRDREAKCKVLPREKSFVGLFGERRERFGKKYPGGSYRYKKKISLLDEIYIRPEDLPLVKRETGSYSIGFEGRFFEGSDHKLLWTEFNW